MTENTAEISKINDNSSQNFTGNSSSGFLSSEARYYSGIDWISILFHLLENIHWILLAAVLSAVIAGLYAAVIKTPIYQATSKIFIAGSETTISLSDIQLGSSLAKDYQEVFKIWHVHEMVDERLGLDYSYSDLSKMITVNNPDGTHLLYINVRSADPEEAKLIADTYAEVVQEFIAEKMELRKPQLLEVAQLPSRPVSPVIRTNILIGFAIGAFISSAVLIILYLLDDRIRTSEDIEKAANLVTLGTLFKQEERNEEQLQQTTSEETEKAPLPLHTADIQKNLSLDYAGNEAINTICSGIIFAGKNLKRIAVTSYETNNGKTFVSIQIANSMAKRGKKVLLIDADFRKSVMIRHYSIHNTELGLAHYLAGQCSLEDIIYKSNIPDFDLIPIGINIKNPLPLLTSDDFKQLMEWCAQNYDYVIVDTPPIGAVIDAADISKHCDATLLVIEYNRQSRGALQYMQRMIAQTGTPIIGCVINNVSINKLYSKHYGYYYRYGSYYEYYGDGDKKQNKHHSKPIFPKDKKKS